MEKYDQTYKKDSDATTVGIFVLIVNVLIISGNQILSATTSIILSLSLLIIHVLLTIWLVLIAVKQNRNPYSWGLTGFFFLPVALIIIGQLKKVNTSALNKAAKDGHAASPTYTATLPDDSSEEDELSRLERNLKPGQTIILQTQDGIYTTISKREWEIAKEKGAGKYFVEIH
jgi:hypothetical protein